jgi:hypothetical protein
MCTLAGATGRRSIFMHHYHTVQFISAVEALIDHPLSVSLTER